MFGLNEIIRPLSPDRTFLAADPAGKTVVIKIVEGDCLLRGDLHPGIRLRLQRVRELAHIGVAHLHGIERSDGRVFAVWQFIEGTTWEEYFSTSRSPEEKSKLGRELRLSVELLHRLGIVHGRLHGGNVIIDPVGRIHLTHISPLLYDDPAADLKAVAAMIGADLNEISVPLPDFHGRWQSRNLLAALAVVVVGLLIAGVVLYAWAWPRTSP